jgi:hypothetical protein
MAAHRGIAIEMSADNSFIDVLAAGFFMPASVTKSASNRI